MGQCIVKKKPNVQLNKSISNELKEATNYAIVDKNMLPKDLVGTIQNPMYVAPQQQLNTVNYRSGRNNNLSKNLDKYDSVYNYIDYDYEVIFNNNKLKDQNNCDNRNKNIYKELSFDASSESSSNNTLINDNQNLIDNSKLSKQNLNTYKSKKILESNSIIIEITAL